jgi:hypothetical protein
LLPPPSSGLEDRCHSWGSYLQSLTPPQSLAPSGFLALMSFLTSRPPALRTRRSRCPATSGLCSLRRSVPDSSETRAGRYSHGILGSPSADPRAASASGPALTPSRTGGKARRLHAPAHGAMSAGGKPDSIGPISIRRAFTRTCPRVLPATAVSCQIAPTSSEQASLAHRPGLRGREDREPEGTRKPDS